MRWIRFTVEDTTRYGLVEGDTVRAVQGSPLGEWRLSGSSFALDAVQLEVPVVPPTFYAAGLNYAKHVEEAARLRGTAPMALPRQADIGYRANNALLPHGGDVIIPADAGEQVQYEGELVAVIGRKARNLSESEALGCVLGYTIGNDVSERAWQQSDRTFWRSKNSDTFKPMGPWIETDFDIARATTTIQVNGQTQYSFDTGAMLFGVAHFISRMSQYLTLWPGDVVWMGTDGSSPNLRHGDVVEVSITGIGSLRNRFIKAQA